MDDIKDVVIVGAGPGGMTAGIYSGRANLDVVMIEKGLPGGQMANTEDIENYPGKKIVKGSELSREMYEHVLECGVKFGFGEVKKITKREDNLFEVDLGKEKFISRTVIISTGSNHLKLGTDGEEEYSGRGVSYCAVCDGGFFRGKEVAVVGGGDSAVEEAIYLTQFVSKVKLLVRRDKLRAQPILVDRLKSNDKIEVIFNTSVERIIGEGEGFKSKLTELELINNLTGEKSKLKTDGIFIYVGMKPNSEIVQDLSVCNEEGYVITNGKMETSMDGLYAIGDVRDTPLRQIISACGDGSIAGQEVYKYIESNF